MFPEKQNTHTKKPTSDKNTKFLNANIDDNWVRFLNYLLQYYTVLKNRCYITTDNFN